MEFRYTVKQPIVIGITGILGSGKTTVSEILKTMGFRIISCDKIVGDLLNKKNIIKKIEEIFGTDVIENGEINKKKVRKIIFTNFEKRKALEKLIHPFVFSKIEKEILDAKKKNSIIFIEIPLLFETKSQNLFDKIIVVSASKNIIKKRLAHKYSAEEIENIWKSQIPLSYKKKKADYIVYNSGSIEKTKKNVKKVVEKIISGLSKTKRGKNGKD